MRTKHLAVLAAVLVVGCARFQAHTGDFATFLAGTLQAQGATLPTQIPHVEGLPATWQAKPDEAGIIILAPHGSFPAIDRLLRGMFGEPYTWSERNVEGFPIGVYHWRTVGCVIQYVDAKEQAQIVILRKPKGQRMPADGTGP